MSLQVSNCGLQDFWVVFERAKTAVTAATQQRSDLPGHVIMIHGERTQATLLRARLERTTDRTLAVLGRQHGIELACATAVIDKPHRRQALFSVASVSQTIASLPTRASSPSSSRSSRCRAASSVSLPCSRPPGSTQ